MDSPFVIMALRLVHILGGVFWVGIVVFNAAFLLPTVNALGPAGGPVMRQIAQVRRLPAYMMASAILVILSGVTLMWRDSRGTGNTWMSSGPGITFSIGGAIALVTAIYGMAVLSPAGRRAGQLAAAMQSGGGPPSPEQVAEMQRLQSRLTSAGNAVAVLLVLATAAMAIARYVP